MNKKISVIDLFAGAGGLSEGFHRQGFNIVAYVEKDSYACQTLLTRHIYHKLKEEGNENLYHDYLRGFLDKEYLHTLNGSFNPVINLEISDITLPQVIKSIRRNMMIENVRNIDVFIGGPPCQAFSLVGRARDPYNMKYDDRNMLYKYYVTLLKEFKPKVFVFENVPGILSVEKGKFFTIMHDCFYKAGYETDYKILNASDFLVLENRKRVILIGWRKNSKFSYPEFNKINNKYTVKEILKDLPPLNSGEKIHIGNYADKPSDYLKHTGIRTEKDVLIQHTTRQLDKKDQQICKRIIKLWKNKKQRLIYTELPLSLRTHKNQKTFLDRFKVVADDLPYSHTMVAHIAKDDRYYMHPDINQLRTISVREAARIQSFPDDYKFEGSRTAQLTQIGNAVPPLMADKIAEKIKEILQ